MLQELIDHCLRWSCIELVGPPTTMRSKVDGVEFILYTNGVDFEMVMN